MTWSAWIWTVGEVAFSSLIVVITFLALSIYCYMVVHISEEKRRGKKIPLPWEARRDHQAMQKSIKEGKKEDGTPNNVLDAEAE